jgi:hypothetical protein
MMGKAWRLLKVFLLALCVARYVAAHRQEVRVAMSETWANLENSNLSVYDDWQKVYIKSGLRKLMIVLLYDRR